MHKKSDAQNIAERLTLVTDYIHDCERRVVRGEIMDLKGLDQNVVDLCNEITAMPRAESQSLEKKMVNLVDSLERLAGVIRHQYEEQQKTAGGR